MSTESPRAFVLARREDVSGVSGTGVVAEGVLFGDGSVALRWRGQWPTSVVFHDRGIESVRAIHGHDGRTEIVWCDNLAARAQADQQDDADALRAVIAGLRLDLARKTGEHDALCVRAEQGGITPEEIERIGDAAWTAAENAADKGGA